MKRSSETGTYSYALHTEEMTISKYNIVYWDDVHENQELPAISLSITMRRCVMAASGTRDLYPIHYDRDFAKQANARDIFVNTMFMQALLSRFMTDWSGPTGIVKKLGIRMQAMNCPGDTITVDGRITNKYIKKKMHLIDLDILCHNERGLTTVAWATMLLPSS